jgi:hypothetical protein
MAVMKRTKQPKPKAEKTRKQVGCLVDSDLYHQARILALTQHRTVGALLDELLQDYLVKNGVKISQ